MGGGDSNNPWSKFDDKKQKGEEEWRSGSPWLCFDQMDVCWMTFFCTPCMIGREWNAAKAHQTYSTNWPVCLLSLFCPIVDTCLVCNLRGTVRKIGDSSTTKDNVSQHIPGMYRSTCTVFFVVDRRSRRRNYSD